MPYGVKESDSLSNFVTNPTVFLEKLRQSGEPLLLTVDGQGEVVVVDAVSYQRMVEVVDRLETIASVKEGLNDVAAGRSRPMREALADLARKHHLPAVESE